MQFFPLFCHLRFPLHCGSWFPASFPCYVPYAFMLFAHLWFGWFITFLWFLLVLFVPLFLCWFVVYLFIIARGSFPYGSPLVYLLPVPHLITLRYLLQFPFLTTTDTFPIPFGSQLPSLVLTHHTHFGSFIYLWFIFIYFYPWFAFSFIQFI